MITWKMLKLYRMKELKKFQKVEKDQEIKTNGRRIKKKLKSILVRSTFLDWKSYIKQNLFYLLAEKSADFDALKKSVKMIGSLFSRSTTVLQIKHVRGNIWLGISKN